MGLDMYLNKRTYVGAEYEHREIKGEINLTEKGKPIPIKLKRVSEIIERVGYWRKANQIHNWFVKNVQDGKDNCEEYWVSTEQFKQLLDDCKKVKENQLVAADVLPTKSGFFFGGTEYDEFYMKEIDETIEIIETLFNESEDGKIHDVYYQSSW